jgi:hypothetical protein
MSKYENHLTDGALYSKLDSMQRISTLFRTSLICVLCTLPGISQSCYEQTTGVGGAFGASYVEPGDFSGEMDATAPQGRGWAYLVYAIDFQDITMLNYPNAVLTVQVDVLAQGQTLYQFQQVVTPAMFPDGIIDSYEDYLGRRHDIYGTLIVEKWIPIGSLTSASPATLTLKAGAWRNWGTPSDHDSVTVFASLHADIRFVLQESHYNFRPKDSQDGGILSTDTDAFPVRWAGFRYACPDEEFAYDRKPSGKIKFTLSNVSNLTGTSTNNGNSTDPDYRISASQEPEVFDIVSDASATTRMMGRTVSDEDFPRASLKIESFDYGGTARLQAEFQSKDGTTVIPAIIDALESGAPGGVPANPNCNCASLPYDADSDGMADSWEAQYGGNLDPTADADRQGAGNSTVGDGLTVAEEYRGFHYITRGAGGTPLSAWISTDPRDTLDLFVWDHDDSFHLYLGYFRSQVSGFMSVREVGSGTSGLDMDGNAKVLNLNRVSGTGVDTYPVLLRNESLGGTCVDANSVYTFGEVENFRDMRPFGPDGRRIVIDSAAIQSCASPTMYSFPPELLYSQVIAHEMGHQLGLKHPMNTRTYRSLSDPTNETQQESIASGEYAFAPSPVQALYLWLKSYSYDHPFASFIAAEIPSSREGALVASEIVSLPMRLFPSTVAPDLSMYAVLIDTDIDTDDVVYVQIDDRTVSGLLNVMNWTVAHWDTQASESYVFSQTDLSAIYVRREQ